MPSEQDEQIYDWMEFTMADGNAFAMARNVTYLYQTPDPDPGIAEQPPEIPQAESGAVQAAAGAVAVAAGASALPAFAEQITEAPAAEMEPAVAEPVLEAATEQVSVESFISESQDAAMDISAEVDAEPDFDSASYTETAAPQTVAPETIAPEIPETRMPEVAAEAPEERAYERRALPIENEDAVLGNNWRDAVIAKAVGADAPKEEVSSEPVDEAVVTAPDQSEGGSTRILLAEDNAINALLTRTLLEADGHTVETVEDGLLAVEAMKSSKYDLIFMDMRMPNMDGLEATRKIRAMDNVSKGLPIIALTANAFDDDRNACFDSGMNDFMTKPVSAEELSEMVRTWTKNKAERDAAAA
jgi:CheY-like chemotaxis protein